ncbi:MAG: SH3 domain-containing C40 family peptidase [Paenibacillus macerans]|uniref:SH3 domain-containing protein n=1 Tax=Paenibacillus macerans TaxID=44252 RepID=A0A6N8F3U9_PAEMA|nr:SH3 domain-containing C40 family peptidase [Paenibacillus macerans]MBS5913042.1 C40 family peptidase [Paenibacillus macerans]MDU5948718.1 SH3 domain-containing C40 family peptidase [Paenibacillus macerans]MDU7475229.1 SH3 domain-containing C40 family peptidase [Paenibacillus macerans]MEC0139848.1 SH3 domain-containing C40 family peptidase [Paenibacillus macerans]MEC0333505.1 SH3 domain-containing C40 family peptidase [Paenibacillus macerans]
MKRSVTIALLSAILLSSYTALPDQASASAAATAGSVAKGHINSGVNLRTKPSLSGKVIGLVKKGSQVTVLDRSTKYFYKVKTQGGTVGYVSANPKYITVSSGSSAPAPKPETSGSVSRQIEQVIQTGMKYLGTPYEFGSNRNTTTTFDCSDFVRQAYKEALGITLPSDSRKQGAWIKDNGTAVYDIGSLKRGDLVFFMSYRGSKASDYAGIDKQSQRITHVAMYLGNGQLLHTYSTKSGGVKVDQLDGAWVHRFMFGGSVLK